MKKLVNINQVAEQPTKACDGLPFRPQSPQHTLLKKNRNRSILLFYEVSF